MGVEARSNGLAALRKSKTPVDLRKGVKMRPLALSREPALFVAQSIRRGGVADVKRVLLLLANLLRVTQKVSVVGLRAQTLDNAGKGIKIYSRLAQRMRGQ